MPNHESIPERLMAYLDGEMSAAEAAEFRKLLEAHPEWRDEAARMAAVVQGARALAFKPPPAEIWDNYWEEIDSRLGKQTGWIALALGGALLAAIGVLKVLAFADNPWVRWGLGLVIAGFVILFVSVLRGHLLERPHDRYRNVRR